MAELNVILKIAGSELSGVLRSPLIIIAMLIVVMLAYLNGAGGSNLLFQLEAWNENGDMFIRGFAQICIRSMMICTIMAAYLGVMSFSKERIKGTINVLTAKPLYRRDIVIGKFLGLAHL